MSEPTLTQSNFEAGQFLGVAGYLIPENGAAKIENGLLDEEGLVYKRGGATYDVGGLGSLGFTFMWEGYFGSDRRTLLANTDDFYTVDDVPAGVNLGGDGLNGPVQAAQLEDYLFVGGGYIYGGSRKAAWSATGGIPNAGTTITMSGSYGSNADVGQLVHLGDQVYRIEELLSSTTMRIDRPYAGSTLSGATLNFYNVYEIQAADVYPISDIYATCAGRLLAVRDGNDVMFSHVNDPHTYDVNDYHETPEGASLTGLGVIGQEAILFTTSGTWKLSGLAFNIVSTNGDPQHRLAVMSRDLILWSGAGIASWEQALIVPAVDGVWILDGTSAPARISRPIQSEYQKYVGLGYQPGQSCVYRGHLFLPILTGNMASKGTYVCRLDRETLPWTTLNGYGAENTAYIHRTNEGVLNRESELIGAPAAGVRTLNCSTFFYPSIAVTEDTGGTIVFILETRTYPTGGGTKNVVRHLLTRYDLVLAPGDESEVEVSWSGDRVVITNPKWNQVKWNQFKWGANTARWTKLDCALTEGTEMTPRCRIGKRRRFIRFRYYNAGPVASLSLKEIVLFTRPARARRS